MNLRSYQTHALNGNEKWPGIFPAFASGARSVLVDMPTGTGKTVLFAGAIRKVFPKRALVFAHRQELVWQARDKIERVTGIRADVEMGEHKATLDEGLFHPRASVIVSSVQTLIAGGDGGGRIGKFDPADFGLLIIDEAHHAVSASYRRVVDYFQTNPNLLTIGVTATPDRADEQALGKVFDAVAFSYEITEATKDGWLVPVDQQMVSIESLDFSQVRTQAGDLNGSDLAALMAAEKNLHGVASATIDIIGNRQGIGFAASVNHARMLCEIFNRHRFGMSAWVHGGTDKDERKQIVNKFTRGDIQWLWNCGVFTEGFDMSGVEVVSMARPTKSRALYAQMAGRAMRPSDSIARRLGELPDIPSLRRSLIARSKKPACLVIDFVGNSGRHKLISTADILGGDLSDAAAASAIEFARRTGKAVRMADKIEEEEEKIERIKQKRLEEEARRSRLVAKAAYKTQTIDPFDVLQIKPAKVRGWDEGKKLSDKQRNVLRKAGYDPDKMDYSRGSQLCRILCERWENKKCTLKQAALLQKCGWSPKEASDMGFEQASKALDQAAKNGWKKPEHYEAQPEPIAAGVVDDNVPF